MGFFSWKCVKSEYSIMNENTPYHKGIVMVLPSDEIVKGDYDGYGRIRNEHGKEYEIFVLAHAGSLEKYHELERTLNSEQFEELRCRIIMNQEEGLNNIKLLLPHYYNKGMKYNSLTVSEMDDNQGFFEFEERDIEDLE